MSRITLLATTFVAGALLLSAAGCSSDDDHSAADNVAAACDSYAAWVGAVAEAQTSLDASSSLGEISDTRDEVSGAHDDLVASVTTVGQDRLDALSAAWVEYDQAVTNLDPNLTVPAAAQQLRGNIASIVEAQNALGSSLGC
ncbi:hypothetical protein [Prescottella equi]|uniref:hypothetical protein n=1 Tax=Rhodococcus hoagii TaxID=43767 RepID=UPI000A11426F|nr:hypothetical protein [Prescottella equi]NKR41600.1 hypothetical protein [Prescottella equi]ORJ94257.1 hypothetical protein A6F58_17390 [Prescottella equi]WJJ11832.1 hypothetical protein P9990_00435 [Prescottella equi]